MNHIAGYTTSNRKIDPARRRPSKPDGSPDDNDRAEIGPTKLAFDAWAKAGLEAPNLEAMRRYRLDRIVAQLRKRDYAGLLCFDPLNIRYITDSSNMQVWVTHNPSRACFVSADGYVVLWDYARCEHLTEHLPLIGEIRTGAAFYYMFHAERVGEQAARFAGEIDSLMRTHGGSNRRLAIDRIEPEGLMALHRLGIETTPGQEVTELARAIKGPDDVRALKCAVHSCEVAMGLMQEALVPGMTENDLWAILHAENIRHGGEWIETRLLSSGPRTNPWFQEASHRVTEAGDMLAFDTDMIGPYGYCADVSRSWTVGHLPPTPAQRDLYMHALEQIEHNASLLRDGVSFRELDALSWRIPERFQAQNYGVILHGVGLADESPWIATHPTFPGSLSDRADLALAAGMVVSVESYCGEVGGAEGVKLEAQYVVTETGAERLDHLPWEDWA